MCIFSKDLYKNRLFLCLAIYNLEDQVKSIIADKGKC